MKHSTPADQDAYEEGRKASAEGKRYTDQCPYEARFATNERPFSRSKMESWFQGWTDYRAENNIQIGTGKAWTPARRAAEQKGKR